MIFYVSFWNSYQAIGHLAFGMDTPFDVEEYEDDNNHSAEHDQSKSNASQIPGDETLKTDSGSRDVESRDKHPNNKNDKQEL